MKWGVSVTGVRSVVKAGGVKTSKKIGRAGEEAGRIAIADGRQKKRVVLKKPCAKLASRLASVIVSTLREAAATVHYLLTPVP